jgi:hypothetical protein
MASKRKPPQPQGTVVFSGDEFEQMHTPTGACFWCARWKAAAGQHCRAFPKQKIPSEVWTGHVWHLDPLSEGSEQRDRRGEPIVFALHAEASLDALREAEPELYTAYVEREARKQGGEP